MTDPSYTTPPTPPLDPAVQRLLLGASGEDDGREGYFVKSDGTLWYRAVDGGSAVQVSGGGSMPVQVATLTLNDAQIKALPTTEIELVAAPGANKMIWPLDAMLICDTTTAAYTNLSTGGQLSVGYAKDMSTNYLADGPLSFFDESAGGNALPANVLAAQAVALGVLASIQTPSGAQTYGYPNSGHLEPWPDQGMVIGAQNGDGDYTGGDPANSMIVVLRYSVVDLA